MPNTDDVDKIVLDNIKLVPYFAKRFKRSLCFDEFCHEWDDLIQEGTLGLIMAAKRYDPSVGIKFSTYAGSYICGYIKTMIRHKSYFIKVHDDDFYSIRNINISRDIDNYDILYNPEDYINHNIDNKRLVKFVKNHINEKKFDIMHKTIALEQIDEIPAFEYNVTRSRIGQIRKDVIKQLKPKMNVKFGVYHEYVAR